MVVTDEDQILACTVGLDVTYDPFVISLDSAQPKLLMLNYVIHHLLNEDIHQGNQQKGKVSEGDKAKKDKDNVAVAPVLSDGPCICWRCGKMKTSKPFAERSQSVAAIPSRLISHYLYKVLTFSLMRYLNQIFEVEICMCIFSFSLLLISFSLRGCDMI